MAATVLNSARAVQMSVYVVRASVKLREELASNSTLARRLESLEPSIAALDTDTRKQFDRVYEAILNLLIQSARTVSKPHQADYNVVLSHAAIRTTCSVGSPCVPAQLKFGISPIA